MNIEEMTQKAVEIRELYRKYNLEKNNKEDSIETILMQFVSDVGDLSRHITQEERGNKEEDFKESTARELAECLTHILVISAHYKINLDQAFSKEFERLKSKLSDSTTI